MFLIDTCIWLELLLDQEKAGMVRQLLESRENGELAISEFTIYSLGIILTRLKKHDAFDDFIVTTHPRLGLRREIFLTPAPLPGRERGNYPSPRRGEGKG